MLRRPPGPPLFPYTTLFRSRDDPVAPVCGEGVPEHERGRRLARPALAGQHDDAPAPAHWDADPVEQLSLPALCLARPGIPPAAADLPGRPAPAAGRWVAAAGTDQLGLGEGGRGQRDVGVDR